MTLARAVIRSPVERALDIGTGCGIQALHLSQHAGSVVATDIESAGPGAGRRHGAVERPALGPPPGSMYDPVAR